MEETNKYEIGGRTFIQRPLVLGQLKQIIELLAGLKVPDIGDIAGLVAILAEKNLLPRALAIVLSEPGKRLRDKDLDALTEFVAENADYLTTLEVVEDFFNLTRPESVFSRLAEMSVRIRTKVAAAGLTVSSAPLPAGTSPGEKKSSGDTPSGSASPS